MAQNHTTVIADGSFDFAGGVDSQAVTTVRSALVPHGLRRDQLAWLSNATVRGGAISPRNGWLKLLDFLKGGYYQGGVMYEPIDGSDPYLVVQIAGHIWKILLGPPIVATDLSAQFGIVNPADPTQAPMAFFCEAEGFLIIQPGDYENAILNNTTPTLPMVYHSNAGTHVESLRRLNGITGNVTYPNINEIPAAMAMVYYADRLWYAQGRTVSAGDIVGNKTSGTAFYNYRDSTHKVTENPVAAGGDGFSVPSQAGNIRALAYVANLDTSLGQGPLYILTRKQVYSLNPPVTRTAWIAADNNTQPVMTVAQINNGGVSHRSTVHINGDLFYQSILPSINSLIVATRFFQQWGNVPISRNIDRALAFTDRSLQKFASGVEFDNRILQGALPVKTSTGNIICPACYPLNFDTIASLGEREPPAWEGMWEGLQMLQMITGDFGGLPRNFALVEDPNDLSIDLWEITDYSLTDNNDARIQFYAEFPAFTWGKEFELKQLMGGEIWVDRVSGTVEITVQYRPDASACWIDWFTTSFCAVRSCAEDVNNPICYPIVLQYQKGYIFPLTLPEPPSKCLNFSGRRSDVGYQFQPKVVIKGSCRVRGIILYAQMKLISLYENLACPS